MNDLIQLLKKYWLGIVLCIIVLMITNFIYGSVCLSVILIGIPCPACGITRAAKLMLTGHFAESWDMHPLLILVILGFALYPIIKKALRNYCIFIKTYVIICLVIFVSFYIYRMKMYFPNIEPMVYNRDNYLVKILSFIHKIKQLK